MSTTSIAPFSGRLRLRPHVRSLLFCALTILVTLAGPARVRFLVEHPDSEVRQQAAGLLKGAQLAPREEMVRA